MPLTRRNIPSTARLLGFAAVCEYRSFTAAATALNQTQAAISRQIRELEVELGVRLFDRHASGASLTRDGEILAGSLDGLERIALAVEEIQRRKVGHDITILTDHSLVSSFVLPRITAFETENPSVRINVISSGRPAASAGIDYDIAISYGSPGGDGVTKLIARDEIFPVAAPSLLHGTTKPNRLQDLARLPLLELDQQREDRMSWKSYFQAHGFEADVRPRAVFDSYAGVLEAAQAGHGVALGWRLTVVPQIDRASLVRIGDWRLASPFTLNAYVAKSRVLAQHDNFRAVLDALASSLAPSTQCGGSRSCRWLDVE